MTKTRFMLSKNIEDEYGTGLELQNEEPDRLRGYSLKGIADKLCFQLISQ